MAREVVDKIERIERAAHTLPELGRITGVGARHLRHLVATGELPAYTAGTKWPRVLWADWLAYLRSTRVAPTAGAREHARRIVERRLEHEGRAAPPPEMLRPAP